MPHTRSREGMYKCGYMQFHQFLPLKMRVFTNSYQIIVLPQLFVEATVKICVILAVPKCGEPSFCRIKEF